MVSLTTPRTELASSTPASNSVGVNMNDLRQGDKCPICGSVLEVTYGPFSVMLECSCLNCSFEPIEGEDEVYLALREDA